MLTRLRVSGFKNLVDVDIHFGPFTCVAGANGVGKSNLFDAILFLSALAEKPFLEATTVVRDEGGGGSLRNLFTMLSNGALPLMDFRVEMLIPREGVDDLQQHVQATSTFLSYRLVLGYRPGTEDNPRPGIVLHREELSYIKQSEARMHLPFPHRPIWRNSVVEGRRTSPYISTDSDQALVKLHQDYGQTGGSGGRPLTFRADTLPRTVLSRVNGQESPTASLARREMLSWRLLQLEPSALRTADKFDGPQRMTTTGLHLPATLHRLTMRDDRSCVQIANRLAELIEDVHQVRVERDGTRELFTLMLEEREAGELPARSLSDGTLRFIALAILQMDPEETGLICLEEPENGIHPQRIQAMIELLRDSAVDTRDAVGEDNPLRQVIINTHSPAVVAQISDDALLFAERQPQPVDRLTFDAAAVSAVNRNALVRGLSFGCLPSTWRESGSKDRSIATIPRGRILDYLNATFSASTSSGYGERRVIDRSELSEQLCLPLPQETELD